MAKKKSVKNKSEVSSDNGIEMLAVRIRELEENASANDQIIAGLNMKIEELEKMLDASGNRPISVSNINGDKAFQDCLSLAMRTVFEAQQVHNVMRNPQYVDNAVNDSIHLAEVMHDKLCERFTIE